MTRRHAPMNDRAGPLREGLLEDDSDNARSSWTRKSCDVWAVHDKGFVQLQAVF